MSNTIKPSPLRHFMIDCAEMRLKVAKVLSPDLSFALKTIRDYASGNATDADLSLAWEYANRAVYRGEQGAVHVRQCARQDLESAVEAFLETPEGRLLLKYFTLETKRLHGLVAEAVSELEEYAHAGGPYEAGCGLCKLSAKLKKEI